MTIYTPFSGRTRARKRVNADSEIERARSMRVLLRVVVLVVATIIIIIIIRIVVVGLRQTVSGWLNHNLCQRGSNDTSSSNQYSPLRAQKPHACYRHITAQHKTPHTAHE